MALPPQHECLQATRPSRRLLILAEDTPADTLHPLTRQLDLLHWPAMQEWVLGHHSII